MRHLSCSVRRVGCSVPPAPRLRCAAPRGFTLVEVLVVLVVLGIVAGVVGLSVAALDPPAESGIPARVTEARSQAIRSGSPVTVEFLGGVSVTFHPDGSATPARIPDGERAWRVDPWTGEVRDD